MKRLCLVLILAACAAFADDGWYQGSTKIGPVRDISCAADGGLICTRTTALSRGNLYCNGATATEAGCVVPGTQTFAGVKTFNNAYIETPVAHGSLAACDGSHKGMWQTCSTHSAPVFCDGTSNIELAGTSGIERELFSVYIGGIPPPGALFDKVTLGSGAGVSVTAINARWVTGLSTDAGVVTFRISDGSNNCDCTVACTSPSTRNACSGSCSFAASATLNTSRRTSTWCDSYDPSVETGNLHVMGTSP